jgi:endo-1,4-beta-xylanase
MDWLLRNRWITFKMSSKKAILILCIAGWVFVNPFAATALEPTNLKDAYAPFFAVGAAITSPDLTAGEQKLLLANFTNLTPENCMKPSLTEPEENKYSFEKADALVDFAHRSGLKVNGHCLVWDDQCPNWFFSANGKQASRQIVLKRMRDHITNEVGHFRGTVSSWDVVNEAISDGPGYLKPTRWLNSIGSDYIAQAFSAAARADPHAELYYNDYSIEKPIKREKALRLIRELKKQNIRIDGIGIQGHWKLDEVPYKDIEDSIIAFHNEGIKVMITELDLDVVLRKTDGANVAAHEQGAEDPYSNGCPSGVLQRQADQYARLFKLFRKHADKISRVTFWGLDDGRSWLNYFPQRRTNYPLLWTRDLKPKPALAAILEEAR